MKKIKFAGSFMITAGIAVILGAAGSSDFEVIGIYEAIRKAAEGFFLIALGSAVFDFAAVCCERQALAVQKRNKASKKENLKEIKEKIYLT